MINQLIKMENVVRFICLVLIFIDLSICVGENNSEQQRKRHVLGPTREGTCSDPLNNCQHICIPNPSKPNRQHRCSCRKNFYLQKDGVSCSNTPDLELNYEILPGNDKDTENKDDDNDNEISIDLFNSRTKRSTVRKKLRLSRTLRTQRPNRRSTKKKKMQLGDGTCQQNSCLNGGLCQDMKLNDGNERKFSCFCRLGFSGPFCKEETPGVKFPRFIEKAYLAFPESTIDENNFIVKIIVKPELLVSGGLIMYKKSVKLNHFLVGIESSKFVFRYENADQRFEITHPIKIDSERWYRLRLERSGTQGSFYVDDIPANMSPEIVTKSPSEMNQNPSSSPAHFVCNYCMYLGGHPQMDELVKMNYRQFRRIERNYIGCMRNFEINNVNIDMRRMPYYGRAVDGLAIESCKTDICTKLQCQNNAKCIISDDFVGQCRCPMGFNGDLCENPIRVKIPKYNGNSFSSYIGLKGTSKSSNQIYIRFKPYNRNGLILYQGYSNDKRGDFLSIYLLDGYPNAAIDLGSGTVLLKSNRMITLDTWHTVNFRRIGRKGILQVDNDPMSTAVTGFSPGTQLQLTIQQNLFVGGVDTFDHVSAFTKVQSGFRGCVQMVYVDQQPIDLINDVVESANLEPCSPHPCADPVDKCVSGDCIPDGRNYFCSCPLRTFEMHCQTKTSFGPSSQPSFNGTSYLEYRKTTILSAFTRNEFTILFSFNFKSFEPNRFIFTLIGQFPAITDKSKSSSALIDESNTAYFTLITNENRGITMDLYYGFKNKRERITKNLLDHLHIQSDQELKIIRKGSKLRFVFNDTYIVDVDIPQDKFFSKKIRFQNMFLGGLNVSTFLNLSPILLSSHPPGLPASSKLIRSLSSSPTVQSGIRACVPLFRINNYKISIDEAYFGRSVSNCAE